MYIKSMIALRILRDIHTKSVDSVLAYTQVGVKSEIFLKLLVGFSAEGSYQR